MASRFLFAPVMQEVQPERVRAISTGAYARLVGEAALYGLLGRRPPGGPSEDAAARSAKSRQSTDSEPTP